MAGKRGASNHAASTAASAAAATAATAALAATAATAALAATAASDALAPTAASDATNIGLHDVSPSKTRPQRACSSPGNVAKKANVLGKVHVLASAPTTTYCGNRGRNCRRTWRGRHYSRDDRGIG
jgi:hypothetical protein